MGELTKRARANKRRGSKWEVDIRAFLLALGHDVVRLVRNGKFDVGDLVVYANDSHHFIIEAKDVATSRLSEWIAEAEVEADNYAKLNGLDRDMVHWVVIWKRRKYGVNKAYVVTSLEEWERTL